MDTTQLEIERAVLASILVSTDALDDVVARVPADAFHYDAYRTIYVTACELRTEGQLVDSITLQARLALNGVLHTIQIGNVAGEDVIRHLTSAVNSRNLAAYTKLLLDAWKLRRFRAVLVEAAADSGADVVEKTAQRLAEIDTVQNDRLERLGSVVDRFLTNLDNKTTPLGLSTHLSPLDIALGSLRFGDVTVIAGRPGMGKTALVTHIGVKCAETSDPCLFFSCEMPREQLSARVGCQYAGINVRKVLDNAHDRAERQLLRETQRKLAAAQFFVDDTPGATLAHVRATIRRTNRELVKEKQQVKLVAVDYIQLMRGDNTETRDQEIGTLTRGLKEIAKEFELHVIALSQLNRAVESRPDKRPVMSDLRESGNIEQDADNIVFIYRDERYNRQTTKMAGIAELLVAKQRNGPEGGVYYVGFQGELTRFYELSDQQLLAAGLSRPA